MIDPEALRQRMTTIARDQSFPDSEPKDAATLILIDRSGSEPKVLMGRRHAGLKFMPGKFVFPGGRIEASDALMPSVGELDPRAEAKLTLRIDGTEPAARAFALATVRETCEETGLLLGQKRDTPPSVPNDSEYLETPGSTCPEMSQLTGLTFAGSAVGMAQLVPLKVEPPESSSGGGALGKSR